jgi:hypothetical protein
MPRTFVRRLDYLHRNAGMLWPYLTARKVANLALNQIEMMAVRTRPTSVPPFIKVEATPLCHLACGGCLHKSKSHKQTLDNKMLLTVERLDQMIGPIVHDLLGVSFSYSGEPLLNKQIADLVRCP